MEERIARAADLVRTVHHVALATVNADGSPHNSPLFAAFDDDLHLFWASRPQTVHSQNIARTGQIFAVVFDSMGVGGGLFIKAQAQEVPAEQLDHALQIFNAARQRLLREAVTAGLYTGDAPQRLYVARPQKLWVNMAERDAAGHTIADRRYEVTVEQLSK